ncbi:YrvL family regulatory protein [Gracilibacillus sp. S3-1-1]|uniref:YrvL family regulatory protein n=1 Tax=Gracilibacillus pellucidus TaxID=3095368 RepID=A0ACC6M819_9BACI|nr:YrvL family regulatory protein [Gracilibacillus sp. S3-1-1]MDX8047115.1 YrvL family regulatory protein [Gracilibacillus sp. S3-1-1]
MSKTDKIIIAVLVTIVLSAVIAVYFFGMAGIFNLLGVQYHSVGSLVLFVILFFVIGIVVELFSNVFSRIVAKQFTGKGHKLVVRLLIEIAANWLVLYITDEIVSGVNLSPEVKVIVAVILGIVEVVLVSDEKKKQ